MGYYIPVENRMIPSLAIAGCSFVAAKMEYDITTDNFDIPVFQGSFTELLGQVMYLNVGFGTLHALVALGCFLGFAKAEKGKAD
eukprot:CAMPEP_0172470604 /NCGR_PEP_ID=MMETSP1065-20121228/66777_1 /TAXON_ID=265537 /ORGANISM="Amphiprora paludosa, Strain CCMP125" /LENGTH=83 /DNA_ID=CAMNT_0013228599 /DNA_START=32 /DNA_END=283 /DNA_ORIENTATION=+